MPYSESIYDFLEEYATFLEGMGVAHKEKLAAILGHDLSRLERSISEQQSMSMRLDQMENHRVKLQQRVGCPESTLQELIDQAPVERRHQVSTIRRRIESGIQEIKFYNGKAMEAARTNLRMLEELSNEEGQEGTIGYDASRRRTSRAASVAVFETKI